jgi:hypothetical protein
MEEQQPNEQPIEQPIEQPQAQSNFAPTEEPKQVELDYTLEHKAFISENDIDVKKIPAPIIKKMRSMNMLLGKYKKQPTDANKNTIIKTDIAICDELLSWKEQDYPDNFIEGSEPKPEPKPEPQEPKPEPQEPKPEPKPADDGIAKLEKQIKDNLFDGNKIRVGVLKSIIGKTPNYPKQKVGSLVLEKKFLQDYYILK